MNAQLTIQDLIQQYIKLRSHLEVEQAKLDEVLKPYKQGMEAIENAITAHLLSLGAEEGKRNISIPGVGTAFRQQWTSAKVTDPEAFFNFVIDNNERQLLTTHVAKDAVREYLAEHNGVLPPGVDFTAGWKTMVRKS